MPNKIKRVLIYRLGSLGDSVVALPCFYLVARSFPCAERRLLTNFPVDHKAPAHAAIIDGTGLVESYMQYPVGMRNPAQILLLWWRILRWRPQVLIYLAAARGIQVAKRDRVFFWLCGITRQIGVPLTEELQTNLLQLDGRTYEAEAARLVRTLHVLGKAQLDEPVNWDLRLTSTEKSIAMRALAFTEGRPLLAVSLGTKRQSGDWGPIAWHALLKRLGSALPEYALVCTGVQVEREATEAAMDGWRSGNPAPMLNLCGKMTPRETAAVLAQARAFVGHDSGPMHLAAAVQTTCIAIFSARQKLGVWFPYGPQHRVIYHPVSCAGCGLDTCIVERKKCVTSITVEEVAEQVLAALNKPLLRLL